MAVEIYNAVIWIMLTCLVIVTEHEQPAASTLYPKNGDSMLFETSMTTYQNILGRSPEQKTYKRCEFDSTRLWRR